MIFQNVQLRTGRKDLKTHPAADIFSMLGADELRSLCDDITAHGLRQKIMLAHEGDVVLDGRNRLAACQGLDVPVDFDRLAEGDDEIAFIVGANLYRRHLNETQRALAAAALIPLFEMQARERQHAGRAAKSNAGEACEHAARALNVGKSSVEYARRVNRDGVPEVVAAVGRGELRVSAAAQLSELPAQIQRNLIASVHMGDLSPKKVRAIALATKVLAKGDSALVEAARAGRVGLDAAARATDLPAWKQRDIAIDPSRAHKAVSPSAERLFSGLQKKIHECVQIIEALVDLRVIPVSRQREFRAVLDAMLREMRVNMWRSERNATSKHSTTEQGK